MSNRRFLLRLIAIFSLSGFAAICTQLRWPHWSSSQQTSYQEFFTVFTGMVGIFLVIMGTYAAFQSAEASRKQASAADRQSSAADAQADAARQQTEISRVQLREAMRPVLALEKQATERRWSVPDQFLYLRNVGSGTAQNLRYWFVCGDNAEFPGADDGNVFCVPPTCKIHLVKSDELMQSGRPVSDVEVLYTDLLGNRYYNSFQVLEVGNDEEISTLYTDAWPMHRGPLEQHE